MRLVWAEYNHFSDQSWGEVGDRAWTYGRVWFTVVRMAGMGSKTSSSFWKLDMTMVATFKDNKLKYRGVRNKEPQDLGWAIMDQVMAILVFGSCRCLSYNVLCMYS